MDKRLIQRINVLLKHISTVENDLKDLTLDQFKESDLMVRATCFSLVQIGEQMNKLEELLKELYPNLPWRYARDMRNLIVHVYNNVKAEVIYSTAKSDLPELSEAFINIKKELETSKNN